MFTGHFAPAMIAATVPRAPHLGMLFLGAQLVDIGFFIFMPMGIEAMRISPGISAMNPMDLFYMPYTHSLLGTMTWGLLFGLVVGAVTRRIAAGVIAGLVVVSHWFLDLLVHVPDLTFAGGLPKLGLGLWDYPSVAMPLEIAFVGSAAWVYAQSFGWSRPFLILVADLALFQAINWFGPAPVAPDLTIWFPALIAFTTLIWLAWRVERPRRSR